MQFFFQEKQRTKNKRRAKANLFSKKFREKSRTMRFSYIKKKILAGITINSSFINVITLVFHAQFHRD